HHPEGKVAAYTRVCDCRKPGIAMIEEAARVYPIDWNQSFFVGDRSSDIDCAIAAKIRGFQILSDQYEMHPMPFANIHDLSEVLNFIPAKT
ncbi:MAG: hypothetical protein EOP10_26415, partial [Proteobacteria bacterium]